jgi:hypothetical protein
MAGFVLVKGDREKIDALRASEEFARIGIGVQLVHSHVSITTAHIGSELQTLLGMWSEEEAKLA